MNPTRRQVLLISIVTLLPGCSSVGENPLEPNKTDTPTSTNSTINSESGTRTPPGDCKLKHNTFGWDEDARIEETYNYENLSSMSQRYFLKTIKGEKGHVVNTTDNPPTEFAYTDVVTKYEILFDGETYILGTWSGAGCRVG